MMFIHIGREIHCIKKHLLPELKRRSVFPLETSSGHWVSRLPDDRSIQLGSDHFFDSRLISARIDQEVWVDTFPVSIGDYVGFVQSGEYFNNRHWPGYVCRSRHAGGDDVIRNILIPTRFEYEWSLLADIPVTNITWFEAAAFAKWKRKHLLNEKVWEYAASGSQNIRRGEYLYQRYSHIKGIDCPGSMRAHLTAFSDYGCWYMLGGIIEWCGDHYETASYRNHDGSPLRLDSRYSATLTRSMNTRGFIRGDAQASDPGNIAKRRQLNPGESNQYTGFRCCIFH